MCSGAVPSTELPSGEDRPADHTEASLDHCEDVPTIVSKTGRQRRKTSQYISKRQAVNLIEALKFANIIGYPLNVSVDISWLFFAGSIDDRTRFARWQQRLSKWTSRRNFPLIMIWTREVGKRGGINTHVLLHIPPWLMESGDFRRDFRQALERAFEPEGGVNHERALNIQPAYSPEGKLNYNLKGIDPRHAKEVGVSASFQGDLEGKRVGCTENISARARKRLQLGKQASGAVLQVEIR
jgi:hypothetical protein